MFAILFFSGPPEPVEPPQRLPTRLGRLDPTQRGTEGGGKIAGQCQSVWCSPGTDREISFYELYLIGGLISFDII